MTPADPLSTARTYHDAWTAGEYERASSLLAEQLVVEVPVNDYPTKESFARALAGFGSLCGASSCSRR